MAYLVDTRPLTIADLAKLRAAGEKLAVLTAYDATFADVAGRAGVDVILVGDSLGNVIQGQTSTLPVTLEQMEYHTACVVRARSRAFVMADLPFGTYHESPAQAMRSAARIMAAGAQCVKLEGGAFMAETVRFLVERGVPVCAHIGLTPQAVNTLGGYRVQGRTNDSADVLRRDARVLEQAGAAFMVMEMVPATLATEITDAMTTCATIGIGAGAGCAGQVLVLHDMLGLGTGKRPRFVKDFLAGTGNVEAAMRAYVAAVKDGSFPAAEHTY